MINWCHFFDSGNKRFICCQLLLISVSRSCTFVFTLCVYFVFAHVFGIELIVFVNFGCILQHGRQKQWRCLATSRIVPRSTLQSCDAATYPHLFKQQHSHDNAPAFANAQASTITGMTIPVRWPWLLSTQFAARSACRRRSSATQVYFSACGSHTSCDCTSDYGTDPRPVCPSLAGHTASVVTTGWRNSMSLCPARRWAPWHQAKGARMVPCWTQRTHHAVIYGADVYACRFLFSPCPRPVVFTRPTLASLERSLI